MFVFLVSFSDRNLSVVRRCCCRRRRCCKLSQKLLSKTTGPSSTKLDINHSWLKGIQFCKNEGPPPFPRGDDKEIAKIH